LNAIAGPLQASLGTNTVGIDVENSLQVRHALLRIVRQGSKPQQGLLLIRVLLEDSVKELNGAGALILPGGLHSLL
jgi:hypothetical protein